MEAVECVHRYPKHLAAGLSWYKYVLIAAGSLDSGVLARRPECNPPKHSNIDLPRYMQPHGCLGMLLRMAVLQQLLEGKISTCPTSTNSVDLPFVYSSIAFLYSLAL